MNHDDFIYEQHARHLLRNPPIGPWTEEELANYQRRLHSIAIRWDRLFRRKQHGKRRTLPSC